MATLSTTMEYFDKLLGEQLLEGEGGGGGETWNTVFEGSVTTVQSQSNPYAGEDIVLSSSLTTDTAKVTFNGVEYILPKTDMGYGAVGQSGPDFTQYPCFILELEEGYSILTQTAGTYSLKIEEPQSGGSSDFSTAEVTITNNSGNEIKFSAPFYIAQYKAIQSFMWTNTEEPTINSTIIVPTGGMVFVGAEGLAQFTPQNTATTGNATVENGELIITGDCTITIS